MSCKGKDTDYIEQRVDEIASMLADGLLPGSRERSAKAILAFGEPKWDELTAEQADILKTARKHAQDYLKRTG